MFEGGKLIWFNGELVPWDEAQVHVLTHALHYGSSVFEGIRVYKTPDGPQVFRLTDHMQRLYDSAKIYRMPIPYSLDELIDVCRQVIVANKLVNGAYIRPIAMRGYGEIGLAPKADHPVDVAVAAWEWGAYLGAENMEQGIRIRTSSFTRHHINITMCKAKANGNYMNSMLALQEAIRDGYDEALLLDVDGYVAEGSGENIFIVRNGVIYTPELTSALDGITRRTLIKLANEAGYEVHEKRITRDEVYIADEAFFTGTAAEVTPIRELDNRAIGAGTRGPITKQLQQRFFDVVHGRVAEYDDWLTYV